MYDFIWFSGIPEKVKIQVPGKVTLRPCPKFDLVQGRTAAPGPPPILGLTVADA